MVLCSRTYTHTHTHVPSVASQQSSERLVRLSLSALKHRNHSCSTKSEHRSLQNFLCACACVCVFVCLDLYYSHCGNTKRLTRSHRRTYLPTGDQKKADPNKVNRSDLELRLLFLFCLELAISGDVKSHCTPQGSSSKSRLCPHMINTGCVCVCV